MLTPLWTADNGVMFRRKFVKVSSLAAVGGLTAGCMGNGDGGDGGGGEGTTTTTETTAGDADTTTEAQGTGTQGTATGVLDLESTIGTTPQGIEVTNTDLARTGSSVQITGTIENTGSQTYQALEVQATLLDESDAVVGSFFHNTAETDAEGVTPFEPGDQWKFTISFPYASLEGTTQYRVSVDSRVDGDVVDIGEETATASG